MIFRDAAQATLRIEYGNSRGSGFHFLLPEIVITNYHVVDGADTKQAPAIEGVTEAGDRLQLELVAHSPANLHDYAILRVRSPVPNNRHVLQPRIVTPVPRGTEVLFPGFPHGIAHLLVQRANVSGLVSPDVFYLDGSINGGNSGGPIIDVSDGRVVGIVTQRRFLGGADLQALAQSAEQLRMHCQNSAGSGSVQIMGIDFGKFSQMMAEAMLILRQSLESNANSGIGIGFSIRFVTEQCTALGIS